MKQLTIPVNHVRTQRTEMTLMYCSYLHTLYSLMYASFVCEFYALCQKM